MQKYSKYYVSTGTISAFAACMEWRETEFFGVPFKRNIAK